jgi:tRNA(adenine34) deaminase
MSDEEIMRIALEEARKDIPEGLFPVGAVITLDGKIIARSRKTAQGHLGHAEIVAMKEAFDGKKFSKDDNLVLYTTVEPCLMCFGTIFHSHIKKVVFGFEDPWSGGTHIKPPVLPLRYHATAPKFVGGVLREESRLLIREYAQNSGLEFWKDMTNPFTASVFK